uniref:uracil phosphoribosyltransferase n=1 Tax=Campylaephora boydenii TaxID=202204 RepID=UPI0025520023|nr:uracil phosphoribosyltransferase [Campylaephora boydenii]WGT74118.1 uracil phosphoribosyltransferase [Campylaephora boydenii]
MKLNIYVISHPIIKLLYHKTYENNIIKFTEKQNESKIMLFLIYEILRKLIDINNIYIHKLNHIQKLSIMNSQQKNYIITNIINNYNLLKEIYETFPQTQISHYNDNDTIDKIKNTNDKTNIIIIEKFLVEDKIINLLKYIKNDIRIKEKQITIACITCTHQILEKISQYYTEINLYTTHIIYNN